MLVARARAETMIWNAIMVQTLFFSPSKKKHFCLASERELRRATEVGSWNESVSNKKVYGEKTARTSSAR